MKLRMPERASSEGLPVDTDCRRPLRWRPPVYEKSVRARDLSIRLGDWLIRIGAWFASIGWPTTRVKDLREIEAMQERDEDALRRKDRP